MEETGTTNIVELEDISKHFGHVTALNDIDFSLKEGEVHALAGDNGSGKSTLIKTIVGLHQPSSGTIYIRGEPTEVKNPKNARQLGIATVYQDLALVDTMSVAANVFLGRTPTKRFLGVLPRVDWKQMKERSQEILESRLELNVDLETDVEFLSGGERQAVAIARTLVTDPDVVILDEPTAALSTDSSERVQNLIQTLNDEGITILVISHSIDEIFDLADRTTVLHNGDMVGTVDTDDAVKDDIVEMMVGGEMPRRYRKDVA
ncbi:sugar ABC transporter ATP-binding protein, partial [Halobacteriales archaeon QS_4_62_28]